MRKVQDGSAQAKLINTAIDMEQYVREAIQEAYNQGNEDATDKWERWMEGYLEDDVKVGQFAGQDSLVGSAYVISENNLKYHLQEMEDGKQFNSRTK